MEEKGEGHLQAVSFAAGAAVLMGCLERAILVSFIEQWRVCVFVALNALLLAILFTSTFSIPTSMVKSDDQEKDKMGQSRINTETKRRRKHRCRSRRAVSRESVVERFDHGGADECSKRVEDGDRKDEAEVVAVEEDDEPKHEQQTHQLSKEELNEKAEAFIAMFRQHLILDAMGASSNSKFHASAMGRGDVLS